MEGKVTVYVNVTQKKNTRIDISSGKVNSLLWTLRILQFVVILLLPTVTVNFLLFKFYGLTFGVLIGSGLNDGQWHSVHLNVLENHALLTVDGNEASTVRTAIPIQIQTGGTYYFGGGHSQR